MPKGELFINGKDAFVEWGISLESSALSALMTPPPNKELISNESRQEHGKRVVASNGMIDSRDINIPFHIKARNQDEFFLRYTSFCNELASGVLEIRTKYMPNVLYRTNYLSCSQFTEYRLGLAKFTLKLNEPNPNDRNL